MSHLRHRTIYNDNVAICVQLLRRRCYVAFLFGRYSQIFADLKFLLISNFADLTSIIFYMSLLYYVYSGIIMYIIVAHPWCCG